MKKLIISIFKNDILEDVALASAYSGAKSEDVGTLFERMATLKEDEGLLSKFWEQIAGEITDKLKSFITNSQITSEIFEITMELSGAYDDSLSPSVKADVTEAMVAGVVGRWFRIAYPGKAPEWEVQSRESLNRAFAKLCHRRRPVRQ